MAASCARPRGPSTAHGLEEHMGVPESGSRNAAETWPTGVSGAAEPGDGSASVTAAPTGRHSPADGPWTTDEGEVSR